MGAFEIRNIIRDRADAQGVWQFHDLDIDIIVEIRLAIMQCQHLIDAGGGRDEIQKRRLRPHRHVACDRPQRQDEAHELNGIAQAVVAADQNAPTCWSIAVPDELQMSGPGPAYLAGSFAADEDRVTDRPRGLEIAAAHRRHPWIIGDIGRARLHETTTAWSPAWFNNLSSWPQQTKPRVRIGPCVLKPTQIPICLPRTLVQHRALQLHALSTRSTLPCVITV